MRRAARAHVVLRVDFEKTKLWPRFDDRLEMLGLETDADPWRAEGPGISTIGGGHGRLSRPLLINGVGVFAGAPGRVTSDGPRHRASSRIIFPFSVTADKTRRSPYESPTQRGSPGRPVVSDDEGLDRGR